MAFSRYKIIVPSDVYNEEAFSKQKKKSGNIFESLNTPFSYYPIFFRNWILSLEMYLVFNLIRTVTKKEKKCQFY